MPETKTAFDVLQQLSHLFREMSCLDKQIDALESQRLKISDQALALDHAIVAILRANPGVEAIDCGPGYVLMRHGESYQLFPVVNVFSLHEPTNPPVETTEEDEEVDPDDEDDDDFAEDEDDDETEAKDLYQRYRSRQITSMAWDHAMSEAFGTDQEPE